MINEGFDYDPSYPYGADLDYLGIEFNDKEND